MKSKHGLFLVILTLIFLARFLTAPSGDAILKNQMLCPAYKYYLTKKHEAHFFSALRLKIHKIRYLQSV